jgi:pyrimidine operon attenuation protein / uracil phosphoribosyltransferase
MSSQLIINKKQLSLILDRLCYQLIENHNDFNNTVLIGLQPRGIFLLNRIIQHIHLINPKLVIQNGTLDVTFHRDDFRRRDTPLQASKTSIDFLIEDKNVVLVDDVLYTGRTIRSGMDALLAFGRPANVELLVLVDRRFKRHLPIQADYIGKTVDSIEEEKVKVFWQETDKEDKVILLK